MNRNYYCKVNSQEEVEKLLKKLSNLNEPVRTDFTFNGSDNWEVVGWKVDKPSRTLWSLCKKDHLEKSAIEVPASELIDYVTGKKVDKDALLKEAIRRFPIGTKFISALKGDKHPFQTIVKGNIYLDKVEGRQVIWNGDGCGFIYDDENWAEIVEEPKVETKFEKGKWYKYEGWYIKFNTLDSSGIWLSSEQIDPAKYYYKREERFGGKESYHKKILLTDLSEIQQYLPAGHPDKFTNPIAKEEFVLPEKWCVKVTKENITIISKWRTFGDCPSRGYCVSDNGSSITKSSIGYWYEHNPSGYTEITFDQFKKYVLKEEVKEEVKKDETSDITWKIGDYVVFTEDCSYSKKGNIDKIRKLGEGVTTLYLEKEGLAGSPLYSDCRLKVFPTLQEAQKFSDELLGKSKTCLRVEDLVEGEIYRHDENGNILKWTKNKQFYLGDSQTTFQYNDGCWEGPFSLANPSEVKWLNTCIKQDKFIPQDQLDKYDDEGNLMESKEYPEYYECILGGDSFTKGKVYKIKNPENLENACNFIDDKGEPNGWAGKNYEHFKPSTKEAYDAQFKKDEEFKDGDWLVYIKDCGIYPDIPIKIGDVKQMIDGAFGSLCIYGYKDLSQYFRKALPWEIPIENSVKQNSLVFEECGSFPGTGILNQLSNISFGTYQSMNMGDFYSYLKNIYLGKTRKSPDLIDKSKVEVKIKRTKVKQIKL